MTSPRHRSRARISATAAALLISIAACTTTPQQQSQADTARIAAIIASPVRTDQDRVTDTERHAAQFVAFTGVRPGMHVLDVSAGGGYTTQLMAIAVGEHGHVWAQSPRPGPALARRLGDHPQPTITVVARPFDDPVPPGIGELDLITLIQNYHDIVNTTTDRAKMNASLFAALKPGGHFVVIDHSARSGTGIAATKTLHRIDEDVVLNEVRKAGFVLDAEGDYLRNTSDTRLDSSGEPKVPTDKFALRFVKPK
jgi:predicted methyltransferase